MRTDSPGTIVITGAFSYTGKYATRLLLNRGYRVRTLTNHPHRENPFGNAVEAFPYNFDEPEKLRKTLDGSSTLINTYWVRFPHGRATFEGAVENSRKLFRVAKDAGVKRIVHVSIANPSAGSPLGYYRGKAEVEMALLHSGLAYTILRPTVIFGIEDILINNIAWFVRRFPVFAIPGEGRYGVRPIYVEDMAQLLVDGVESSQNAIINAVGPETFTFEDLVALVARSVGRPARLVHTPMSLAYVATLIMGLVVRDVVLTREEYRGLMGNLLSVDAPSSGETRLSTWLVQHGERVGVRYASEVARHF